MLLVRRHIGVRRVVVDVAAHAVAIKVPPRVVGVDIDLMYTHFLGVG
jgi:hypothetical protein